MGVRALAKKDIRDRDLLLVLAGSKFYGQATKSMRVDALAQVGEEGRGQLRKASGRCKQPAIRRYPNGGTQQVRTLVTVR
jgi:hypothetical protein